VPHEPRNNNINVNIDNINTVLTNINVGLNLVSLAQMTDTVVSETHNDVWSAPSESKENESMSDLTNGAGSTPIHLYPVPGLCPVCGGETHVTRVECGHCHTGIDGHFALDRFAKLTTEQLAFLEVFLKNRGVIKDVEAELGISYPTVRGRLDDVIRGLGLNVTSEDTLRPSQMREERRQILEALRAKEITADDAATRLAALGSQR
jgi:hypothetical protein